ncbi:ATP-binding cassette domain-containing protein [Mesorhizobium sp. STM 4661]|uniref:ATP-binding cassette domain-containing protein n=1 Tax=Mesorhizobium sp. STM 4661 TaxID=1297570 RepID=UPI0002BE33F7|nr:ATP-binding cassette domain-containing protein [Mesorhizobium sp. STM 4661]CCV16538.1 Inner-membrane translocator [Mesorhizobium sp. STM 4661]
MQQNDRSAEHPHGGAVFISARNLSKSFDTHEVLRDVSLDIRAGEILVLLGPNGAGKSTMLNILGGTLRPSSGGMAVDGEPVEFDQYISKGSRARSIQRVFQELSTFPNLTVAENLDLTAERSGARSRREIVRRAAERMQVFPGNRIDVCAEVARLSVAERQMVEIARAMTEPNTRLVILDEPTSALSAHEADQLAELVARKAAEGVAIIYVTHKLEEALRLAHRVVVLRDGKLHFDGDGRNLTHDALLSLLGATVEAPSAILPLSIADASSDLLSVQWLSTGCLRDVSIRVGAGELVGIAGLEGAGQRELLQAIFAARERDTGAVRSVSDIAYISGDRKREGLLPLWNVEDNVAISAVPRFARAGVVDFSGLKARAHEWLSELGLSQRADSPIVSLSGGNQQRALLGRALASEAPLLLLDDPTRGVDVKAKASIYAILDKLKEKGRGGILYSTEVAEFHKCDRVYVMARGRVAAEFDRMDVTEERIVQASFLRPTDETPPSGEIAPPAGGGAREASLARLLSWRSLPAAVLMVSMFALAFWQQPNAFSSFGLELLLQASLPLAFAVLAQMLFLLGGDIDLGLGFAIGLANVLAATYLVDAPVLGILALAGLVAGYVLLAFVVELLGVSSVVATLGASFIWLGIGLTIRETPGGKSPEWLSAAVQVKLWPLPLPCVALAAVALLGFWICRGWGYSIRLRALGNNRRTYVSLGFSALAGRVTLYALAGVFAVLSGLVLVAATGAGNVHVASSFTLATIAAVVVGGASFAGGLVSPVGAVMAVVAISLVTTNLTFLGISSEYSTAIGGLILVLALSFRSLARSIEP